MLDIEGFRSTSNDGEVEEDNDNGDVEKCVGKRWECESEDL